MDNDHRKIGFNQQLFMHNEYSPANTFFLPHGTRIFNTLKNLMQREYFKRDYQEVITPIMYKSQLWEISGHWQKYREHMFQLSDKEEGSEEIYALKAMNCPSHCLMFRSVSRSYKDLPMRLADFGDIHRNEATGACTGLLRVRNFHQDDAHIFCREDQIESEITGCLAFLKTIYQKFGFTYDITLSTRPDKYMGELELWDRAEKILENCLNNSGDNWIVDPKDGSFYGPKIDIMINDALGRKQQCGTIQLDFQVTLHPAHLFCLSHFLDSLFFLPSLSMFF